MAGPGQKFSDKTKADITPDLGHVLSPEEIKEMESSAQQGASDDAAIDEMEKQFTDESAAKEPVVATARRSTYKKKSEDDDEADEENDNRANQRGQQEKKNKLFGSLSGKSGFKKRLALAGALAGGSAIASVFIFLVMLPLKIEHVIQNLDTYYGAATNEVVQKESEHLMNGYVKNVILPALNSGTCRRTVDPTCVVTVAGDGPVARTYQAWKKGRIENKLARNYGLIFARDGNNYHMTVNGRQYDLDRVRTGNASIFDLPGVSQTDMAGIRQTYRDALSRETFWKRNYHRFVFGSYMHNQLGIVRCVWWCKPIDKATQNYRNKKMAAKAWLVERLVPGKYGLIMECMIVGCKNDLPPVQPGEEERLSDNEKSMRKLMREAATKFGTQTLEELVKQSEDLGKNGFGKVFAREAVKKLVSKFADTAAADAAGLLAEKAVPVIGWIFAIAKIIDLAHDAGPMLKYLTYALNESTAIEMYTTFSSVAAECKTGGEKCDGEVLGSFSTALETNIGNDDSEPKVDMTDAPLYNSVNGGNLGAITTASISPFSFGSAKAASAPRNICEDSKKPVPAGKLVCDSERYAQSNSVLMGISAFIDSIPLLAPLANIFSAIGDAVGKILGFAFDAACTAIPGCQEGMDNLSATIAEWLTPLFNWIGEHLVASPFAIATGARNWDNLAGGASAANAKVCHVVLGCAKATDKEIYQSRVHAYADAQREFEQETFFARMFDTESSYSLISRLAVGMPSNFRTFGTKTMASLAVNPFAVFGNIINSTFSHGNAAFAQVGPVADPHGIIQYNYDESMIPVDPDATWKANDCENPDQLTKWLNDDNYQDPETGQATSDKENPCLLIKQLPCLFGIKYDASLVAECSKTGQKGTGIGEAPAAAPDAGAGGPLATGSTQDLARQVSGNPNITFQTKQGSDAFDRIIATGTASECGAPPISPVLLGVILKLAESYKLVLGVFTDGHGCDGGFHSKGMAVDINGVNPLNGGVGTGTNIRFEAAEMPILLQFYDTAGQVLKSVGGGGLGQVTNCITPTNRQPPPVIYFSDTCNHIHLDVGKR